MRMKVRKSLYLDRQAVAAGERAAAKVADGSLSQLVEKQLLSLRSVTEPEHFSRHTGKPVRRPGDARFAYLKHKHG
jgi:hypothetical protein